MLGDLGYKTVVAHNGQEALDCVKLSHPDLILSDVMMPVMDGRELCQRLHNHPEYRSLPVVLMSAAYRSITLQGCTHSAFLKKPFRLEELEGTLSNILDESPGSERS